MTVFNNLFNKGQAMNNQATFFSTGGFGNRTSGLLSSLRGAAFTAAVAGSLAVGGMAQAAVLTWTNGAATDNWNTTDLNWDSGGPTAYTDGGVDDVIFDGTAPGTINIQPGGVTANSMTVTGGTYHFTGAGASDTLGSTPITLTGGTVQYTGAGRLGTGQINVTGNLTIQSLGAGTATSMDNSAMVVSDGVSITFRNNGGGTPGTPTMPPISGGSLGNPINVNINTGAEPTFTSPRPVLRSSETLISPIAFTCPRWIAACSVMWAIPSSAPSKPGSAAVAESSIRTSPAAVNFTVVMV